MVSHAKPPGRIVSLECELHRHLQNSWIACRCDLPKIACIQSYHRHIEPDVIQHVERLEARIQLDLLADRKRAPQTGIHVPPGRPADHVSSRISKRPGG